MGEERIPLPHKLILNERRQLTMTGALEVISFDENVVVLHTQLGQLTVHGKELQLRQLQLENGQVAIEGTICAMVYEEPRQSSGFWRRMLG